MRGMDPLGLALENFNALGLWREKENGQPIDASGRLLTGESFHDVRDLKRILKERHRLDFYRCLTEKLLTYALGRGLDYDDVETVDQIVERLDREGGRFSALLMGVIESAPFQKRRDVATVAGGSTPSSKPQRPEPSEAMKPDHPRMTDVPLAHGRELSAAISCGAWAFRWPCPPSSRCCRASLAAAAAGRPACLATTAVGRPAADGLRLRSQRRQPGATGGPRTRARISSSPGPYSRWRRSSTRSRSWAGSTTSTPIGGLDGPGDHARASGTFLTGVRVKKTAGADIHAGVSVDQVAAQRDRPPDAVPLAGAHLRRRAQVGQLRFRLFVRLPVQPVVEQSHGARVARAQSAPGLRAALRCRRARASDTRTSSCAASSSGRSSTSSSTTPARSGGELGDHDQKKLDEYLTSVREIERRLERAERFTDVPNPAVETPAGIPASFREHIQLMFDMMILAFQTDSTRIATFLLANESSNRTFPDIKVTEGHHNLSHHRNKKEMLDKIAEIDRWYMQQFARFLEKMDAVKDVDGNSLLHNSMIVYGSGNGDGNRPTTPTCRSSWPAGRGQPCRRADMSSSSPSR